MDEEAIPRHLEILRTAEVGSRALWPAIEHTYNRALGKVKDSVEISGRLENLQLDLKAAQELDMLASKAEAEITKGYEQAA